MDSCKQSLFIESLHFSHTVWHYILFLFYCYIPILSFLCFNQGAWFVLFLMQLSAVIRYCRDFIITIKPISFFPRHNVVQHHSINQESFMSQHSQKCWNNIHALSKWGKQLLLTNKHLHLQKGVWHDTKPWSLPCKWVKSVKSITKNYNQEAFLQEGVRKR